jgi:hypothetical protein
MQSIDTNPGRHDGDNEGSGGQSEAPKSAIKASAHEYQVYSLLKKFYFSTTSTVLLPKGENYPIP